MKRAGIFFVLMLAAFSAVSASLTTQQAGKWMDAMQELESWGQTHPQEMDSLKKLQNQKMKASPPDMTKPPSLGDAVEAIKNTGFYGDVTAIVKKHGFGDLAQWAAVGDKVMRAFIAMSMKDQNIDAEMQEQLKMMDSSPNIPDAQKEMVRKSMAQMKAMMDANRNAPAGDIEAIKPLMSRFEAMQNGGGMGR